MRFVLLFFLLGPVALSAQDLLRFPSEILSAKKSSDQKRIALTTRDSVYIIDATKFSIIKKWKHREPLPVILGFHPYNNNVLLLQRNVFPPSPYTSFSEADQLKSYLSRDKSWKETPEDSISLWDISESKLLRTAAGSFFVQFGEEKSAYAGVMNEVFSYQYQGATNYSARSAELFTTDSKTMLTTKFQKACKRLLMDPQMKHLAISWYDGYINSNSMYSFNIVRFSDHQILLRVDSLPEMASDFCFSPQGDKLAVAGVFTRKSSGSIRIYESGTGTLLQEIPQQGDQLEFSPTGDLLQCRSSKGDWIQWNWKENKVTQKVWSGLTSLWSLNQIMAIGDRLLLAGIAWKDIPMSSEKLFQMQSIALEDLKLFSSVNDPVTRPLSDSNSFTLQMNDVSKEVSMSRTVIQFNSNRSVFSSVKENQLQIWDVPTRKKILQRNFQHNITASPDRSGDRFLIVEQYNQESFSDYRLHQISLQKNSIYTSGVIQSTDSTMRAGFGGCECKPAPYNDNTWICTDGSGTIWEISGDALSQKRLLNIPDQKIVKWEYNTDGTIWFLTQNTNEENLLWKADLPTGKPSMVEKMSAKHFFPDGKGYWIWNSNADSSLQYRENGTMIREVPVSGKIQKLAHGATGETLFVQIEKRNYQYWQLIQQQKDSLPAVRTEWISARMYPLPDQTILAEEEGFHSLLKEGAYKITWTIAAPRILSNTNFDVSASGRYILLANHVIDLKEIAQWNTDKYVPATLLSDSSKAGWVELVSENDYSGKKAGFTIRQIKNNGRDTLWAKQWFRASNVDPFAFTHEQLISSADKRYVLTSPAFGKGKGSPSVLWDLNSMTGTAIGKGKENEFAFFNNEDQTIIVSSSTIASNGIKKNETIEYYSIQPLKKLRQIQRTVSFDALVPYGTDRFKIATRNIEWYQNNNDSFQLKRRYYSRDYLEYVAHHAASDLIVAGTNNGSIHFWERQGSASPITTLEAHHAAVIRMEVRGDRLFTLGADGSITLTSIPEKKILVRVITLQNEEGISMAFYTPEGYYKADPEIAPAVHFVKSGAVYPLSSFEYQGNRPDKVYAAMGFSDPAFISLLQQSWENRLQRAGIKTAAKPSVPLFPAIEWNRKNIPVLTRDSILTISVAVKDVQKGKTTLYLRINGVPVGSKNGLPVPSGPEATTQQIPVTLHQGKNRLSIIAVNEKGEESVEQEHDIFYDPAVKKKARIFYAGVGVSKYADSSFNLRYAAKDVEDIAVRLKPYFDSVSTFTLTNEKATRANILQLHEWLQQTGVNDIVILSLSGHGVIENKKGFHFAPHNMNFNDPAQAGISMNDLESILDNIPARKRLLLLDACHSGEEWSDTLSPGKMPAEVSITRGGKIKPAATSSSSPKRESFLLMKELFSDLSRGNGAFMIAAAGSNEYAYEGKEWKNGVFTKSFLESIGELRYRDSFRGAEPIPVRALRKLIYEKVTALTKGLQNPTSRQENGWWNWEVE